MGILSEIFSSGAKGLADSAFNGLDKLFTSKEEKGEQVIRLEEIKNVKAQMEMDFKLASKELQFKISEQEYKDRDSARDMQSKTKSKIPGVLAIVFTCFYFLETVGFLALLFSFISVEIPDYAVMFISSLWGATSAIEVQIISFYFGSSKGSEDQSEKMGYAVASATRGISKDNE